MNIYRYSAMVRQYTDYWCVPAATQSMVNLVRGTSNKRYLTQKYYYKLTRQHNRYTYRTLGNDPQGWAWALDYFAKSTDYVARAYSDKTQAVNSIAEALRRTKHPVGVTVRGGTHAWVVLGYRSSVNLADPSKRTLLGLYVSGPLGTVADRWPYRYLTVSQFRDAFTRYHEWQRKVIWEGKWVVIAE
jgi:predicted MPP superfamily phosphohydrolase